MSTLRLAPFPVAEHDAWLAEEIDRRFRWQFLPLYDHPATAREGAEAAVASLAPSTGRTELWQLTDVERPADRLGWVWLMRPQEPRGDLLILDADTVPHSDTSSEALLALLIESAGLARHLLVDRMAGAAVPGALAAAGAMTPTSTNLALRLEDVPQPAGIRLTPMDGERFEAWKERNILDYAQEVEASTTADHEEAMRQSLASFAELLPDDLATPDHALFDVRNAHGDRVGTLWIARRSPTAYFVYDVAIDAAARGRGLGRAAMNAAAAWARSHGGNVLALNVFGSNHVARNLYRSLGYEVVVEQLALEL